MSCCKKPAANAPPSWMARACVDGLPDASFADGAVVLVRSDLNVPLAKDGTPLDDARVTAAAPTLSYVTERGARVLFVTHVGRPKGKDASLSTAALVPLLRAALPGVTITHVPACVGPEVEAALAAAPAGSILLLENIRFEPGETANDPTFATALAAPATTYVNDAFGAAHRAHASTAGVADAVRARGGAAVLGLLMRAELAALGRSLCCPRRPLLAVVGGAKPSTKASVIDKLAAHADFVALAGGLANTFIVAAGGYVGASAVATSALADARATLADATARGAPITLPVDSVAARSLDDGESAVVVPADAVPAGLLALDAGPATVAALAAAAAAAATIVWNGPLGAFKSAPFDAGTRALVEAMAHLGDATHTIVGGGHTVAAVNAAGLAHKFGHVSTGGGASLELLEGRVLPGVAALDEGAGLAGVCA